VHIDLERDCRDPLFRNVPGETEETHEMTADAPAEIRTGYLPYTNVHQPDQ
jgi:hypothetical protein